MAEAELYNQEGKKIKKVKLNPEVFAVPMNEQLLYEAVIAAMAGRRRPYAHTKGRGEVRGGGRKPWRQKGTGRARHGSIRSPIWVGGGVTFGPTKDRVFEKRINKKVKKKALLVALSERAKEGGIILLEACKLDQAKSGKLAKIFKLIPIGRKVLVVLDKPDRKIMQAAYNLDWLRVIGANNLNIIDVLNYSKIVILQSALETVDELYALKK
ncbi:50S ribosomal protein L4 [Patescibacteria group bacterium]|nr:50S ribosomal protein L4 [Patescibacteria group bacterium]MBU1922177.1 50S ribosomal protein L4 [Patescibacteria group bacterium]